MNMNSTLAVYIAVRDRIINKEYWPGYHIVETSLANEFKLSRSPIRNALKQLDEDGFLMHSPGKGFFVSADKKSYTVLHEIRKGMDSAAAMLIAQRCSLHDIDRLSELAVKADAVENEDRIISDKMFHDELVRLSGSQLLGEFNAYLTPLVTYSRYLQAMPSCENRKGIINSHILICDCIKGAMLLHTPTLAEQGVQLHYACGEKLYSLNDECMEGECENDMAFGEYFISDDIKDLFAKKTEIIYQNLFNDIISGQLMAGDRVNESQLAGKLGCSRVTVRTAVQKLEKDGYVKIVQNKGAIVQGINPENHSDLIWARYAIEPVASQLCAKNMTATEKKRMFNIIKRGRDAYKAGDYWESLIFDTELHNHIVKCCGNAHVKRLYEMIAKRTHYERCLLRDAHTNDAAVWPEHNLICRAINDGNDEAAYLTMQTHIKRIYGV